MTIIKLLGAAAAVGLCLSAAVLASLGVLGWRRATLDVANSFAPGTLCMAVAGATLALFSLPQCDLRASLFALSGAAAAYGFILVVSELRHSEGLCSDHEPAYRVLSANLWVHNPSPGDAIDAILQRDPDAVLLQEVDGSIVAELPRLSTRYPYSRVSTGGGTLILLKTAILNDGSGSATRSRGDRDFVWVTTYAGGRTITLATTHFSQPLPPRNQETERTVLAKRVLGFQLETLVLAGDFNATPWSSALKRQDELLKPLRRVTIAWFTWPAWLVRLKRCWPLPILPIDHVYVGSGWLITHMAKVRIHGSDHFGTEIGLINAAEANEE